MFFAELVQFCGALQRARRHDRCMARRGARTTDRLIDRLSAPFDGTVRAMRLLEANVTEGEIGSRLDSGRLIVMFPGVYLVGHRGLTERRIWWACVMAGGTGSALSRRSAGEGRALVKNARPWEVTVAIPPTGDVRALVGEVPLGEKQ